MSKSKQLTKRQSAVIEDLFTQDMEEQEVLERHHVTRTEYDRWLADERFTSRIEQRIAHAYRRSRVILARHATKAATRLTLLSKGEKGETARKACLNIIAMDAGQRPSSDAGVGRPSAPSGACGLTPEMAGRLLAALAQVRQDANSCVSPPQGQDAPRL